MMAKQILADERRISIPAVQATLEAIDAFGKQRTVTAVLAKPKVVDYLKVDLEVRRGARRADAIGVTADGHEHWVEIFVRHSVDAAKTSDLSARETAAFEIQLDDLEYHTSYDQLRHAVTDSPERIRWVSHPGMAALKAILADKLERILAAASRQKKADDERVARAYAAQVRAAPNDRWGANRRFQEQLRGKTAVVRANQVFRAADETSKRNFVKTKLRIPDGLQPDILNVAVSGDDLFGVPRDIWQGDVYRKWVFAAGRSSISIGTVRDWMELRYQTKGAEQVETVTPLLEYFTHLDSLNIVRRRGRDSVEIQNDIAPWLEEELRVTGTWRWSSRAEPCNLERLHAACDDIGLTISTTILSELYQRLPGNLIGQGSPESIARSVAQRHALPAQHLLAVLTQAGSVECLSRQQSSRTSTLYRQAWSPNQ